MEQRINRSALVAHVLELGWLALDRNFTVSWRDYGITGDTPAFTFFVQPCDVVYDPHSRIVAPPGLPNHGT